MLTSQSLADMVAPLVAAQANAGDLRVVDAADQRVTVTEWDIGIALRAVLMYRATEDGNDHWLVRFDVLAGPLPPVEKDSLDG